jgi:hypothetical protein
MARGKEPPEWTPAGGTPRTSPRLFDPATANEKPKGRSTGSTLPPPPPSMGPPDRNEAEAERANPFGGPLNFGMGAREPAHNQPVSNPPPNHEHHPTTKIFDYVGLGLLLAPPAVVLEMYLKDEPINWWRVGLACLVCWVAGGLAVFASRSWRSWSSIRRLGPYLIAAEGKLWVKAIIVAIFMAIPSVVSPIFSSSPTPVSEAQMVPKADYDALNEKLTKANEDNAALNQKLDRADEIAAHIQQNLQNVKEQLEATRQAAHQPPPPPLPEDQVPIRWQPNFSLNYNGEKQIIWIRFVGEATALDHMKSAYVISNITGQKEQLKMWLPPDPKRWDADQTIPRGASINLMMDLAPPLPVGDFLNQWGSFEFHITYDDKEFLHSFNQSEIEQQLTAIGLFGPHIVPK